MSDDAGVAIADLPRGSNWPILRGVAAGEAVIVVTARDPGGEQVSQSLTVTVGTVAAPERASGSGAWGWRGRAPSRWAGGCR